MRRSGRHMGVLMHPAGERGTTLIDVLVAFVLMGIMGTGIFAGFRAGFNSWLVTKQYAAEQQNSRNVVNQIARAARMAGYNYTPTPGAPTIIYADAHEVDFFADIDNSGTPQCYRFYANNGAAYEAKVAGTGCGAAIQAAAGQPLTPTLEARALTVTELDFAYFSAADLGGGSLTSTPLSAGDRALVHRVDITVKLQGLSATETPMVLTTECVIRQGG